MDTSLTVKPRDPVSRSVARPSVARTEVAPTHAVTPTSPADPNHHLAPAQDSVGRDLVDPKAQEVIYRERDERERNRRRRPPDEALMRARAYGRAAATPANDSPDNGDAHADIEI